MARIRDKEGWTARLFMMLKIDKKGMFIDRMALGGNIGRNAKNPKGLKLVGNIIRVEVIAAEGDDREDAEEFLMSRVPFFAPFIDED